MNRRATAWGILASAAGALLLTGVIGGGLANGPRTGMGVFLLMLGMTGIAMAATPWLLRKTTRPEDYKGSCPVGESCPDCGAFNYKPRAACRSCGAAVNQA